MQTPHEQVTEARCPACQATGLLLTAIQHDIPYFGDVAETVVRCRACGFRHADFMVLAQKEPVRWTIPIRPDTLDARVVRSSSGTWRVPELGFAAEPTSLSESFVTNVEGMLDRVRDVLLSATLVHADDDTRVVVAERLLARLDRIAEGAEPATLVLEDPTGNSLIAGEAAERVALTPEEAAALETGFVVLDKSELE